MTSDPGLKLRVTRLENDTESIYEILTEMRSTQDDHTRRFDAVDARFEAVDARFTGVESRLDRVESALGEIGTTLTEVVRRLPEPS